MVELLIKREFDLNNNDGSRMHIEHGFKKDWRYTKRVSIYDEDGSLSQRTKWATNRKWLNDKNLEQAKIALEKIEDKLRSHWTS